MNTHIMSVLEIVKYLESGTLESIDAKTALRVIEYYEGLLRDCQYQCED